MEKELTREQIAYDAKDLFAGGWRAADRDEMKEEYGFTDWGSGHYGRRAGKAGKPVRRR